MIPHSHGFAADMHSKSKELAAEIAASVSPSKISTSCAAVESFLSNHTPDQHRWFFSITFPTLICRLFGFDHPSNSTAPRSRPTNGWIDVAVSENDSELAGKIFRLLSPNGLVMSSILEVDRLSLVKYVFPIERLPEWIQYMVQNERDYSVMVSLCPLLKNRVKEDVSKGNTFQIHLSVFEYYLFWFAYYPICRRNNADSESVKVQQPKKFKLENWTNSFPSLSSTKVGTEKKGEVNLYLHLLYSYLQSFVPFGDENVLQPYHISILHYPSGNTSPSINQAEFVVHTFINFWFIGNDFSPVPVGLCKSFSLSSPLFTSLGETTPSKVADVANVFVKYLNQASFPATTESSDVDCVGSFGWNVPNSFDNLKKSRYTNLGVHPTGSWISLIQRPLYRFILRTFMFSPVETSMMNVSQAFTLWVDYIEPWSTGFEELSGLDQLLGKSTKNPAKDMKSSSGYSPLWQGYVIANYLFYSSLVLHFIGFAHKFLHTDTNAILQMVVKVMTILTSTTQLMDLIKHLDVVYHSKTTESPKSVPAALNSFIPTVRQQLQDWEYGLCESDAGCSFPPDSWNTDLRLFADGEKGGQHLLQLFVMRAEAESQCVQNLQLLDTLKSQLNLLFGTPVTKLSSYTPKTSYSQHKCHDIFNPRSFGTQMRVETNYQVDSMKRPISEDEITWLAKLLVNLSCWVNESLGLNRTDSNHNGHDFSYVEIQNGLRTVHGSVEIFKVVLCTLQLWITWLGGVGVQYMRSHGLRVNLRILASKKVMVLLLCFTAYTLLKKALAG